MEEIYLPNDIIDEMLMKMTINEILKKSTISKQWKERVNTLWCRLLDRDYKIKTTTECKKKYREEYSFYRDLVIKKDKI